jgi:hypothetical protein
MATPQYWTRFLRMKGNKKWAHGSDESVINSSIKTYFVEQTYLCSRRKSSSTKTMPEDAQVI